MAKKSISSEERFQNYKNKLASIAKIQSLLESLDELVLADEDLNKMSTAFSEALYEHLNTEVSEASKIIKTL